MNSSYLPSVKYLPLCITRSTKNAKPSVRRNINFVSEVSD